jgi:DNA-directed RNA polymerase specialized sigma24 family protein
LSDRVTDRELLESGDVDSFAEFYRRHARRLAGRLMRATADAEVAADLTAETFAAALAARTRYRPERDSPATWLHGIATHKLNDWLRRGYAEDRARRRLGIERISLTEDDVWEFEHLAGEVAVEERRYTEIAGAEGVSEAAIRQRVSRGLAGLRRRIGGER